MRNPVVAGQFYPASASQLRREVEGLLEAASLLPEAISGHVYGVVAPHAGYVFSGYTAARAYLALATREALSTLVLLGAVHSWGVDSPTAPAADTWSTPLGEVQIDTELRAQLAAELELAISDRPHSREHSLEVQLPFIQVAFPQTRILPLAVPPGSDVVAFGQALGQALEGQPVAFVASSDLTHYGDSFNFAPAGYTETAVEWVKNENDARLVRLLERLEASALVPEAARHHNACGSGALAAAAAACQAQGATKGIVLDYRTSYDVLPDDPSHFVGYVALAWL